MPAAKKASKKRTTRGAASSRKTSAAKKTAAKKKTVAKKAATKKKTATKRVAKKTAKKVTKKTTKKLAKKSAAKKPVAKKKSATKKKATKAAATTTRRKTTTKKKAAAKKKVVAKKASAKKKVATKKKTAPRKKVAPAAKSAPATNGAEQTPRAATKRAPERKAIPTSRRRDEGIGPIRPPIPVATTSKKRDVLSGPIHGIEPYKPARGEEYMSPGQLEHFREILLAWKRELMQEVDRTVHHMQDEAANFPDPNDRATQESEFGLELRTRDRERKLLRKIDQALGRIEDGTYGYCEATGEEIGLKRLEARPVATMSLEAQERRELAERQFRDRDDRYR
ncbi:MAG: RNA polymerase-binding protein DksA [Pseudomonadota bacterium]